MRTRPSPVSWLDATDRRILKRLELDARAANQDIAQCVGLSPSACLHRIRRLEKTGVIMRYVTDIAEEELGPWLVYWCEILLTPKGRAHRLALENAFAQRPEIIEAHQIAGRGDYLLRVAGDTPMIWPSLLERIDPDGTLVAGSLVQTRLRQAKRFGGLPQLAEA
jgi:Lrp/AsnC family leucine-responsive transcriptional regulator